MLLVVGFVTAHDINGSLREIAGVDLQQRVLVVCQDREGSVACTSADFEECLRAGIFLGDFCQDGKFLLQPLAVLEEVGGVVLVELVPPLRRVRVESFYLLVSTESLKLRFKFARVMEV